MKTKRKSSVYTDKRGYSYYQTWSWFNTKDGKKCKTQKPISKSLNKTQVKQLCNEWDEFFNQVDYNHTTGNPYQKPPIPLSKIVKEYIDGETKLYELGDISISTLRINRENINLFKEWFLANHNDRNVDRITTKDIDNYRTHRRLKKHNGDRLSDNTIRINLRVVRTFFNWCLKKKYIGYTPFTEDINIPSYSKRTDEETPLGEDWNKLFSFIEKSISFKTQGTKGEKRFQKFNDNEWFKYVIYIMCNTGMRPGEVRMLKWKKGKRDNPNQRQSYSYLDRNFENIHIFFKAHYSFIPIKKDLRILFEELAKSKGKNTYIFQSPITELPYDKSIFNKMFRQLMVNLDMVDEDGKNLYTPHSIRHGVVSNLMTQNVGLGQISRLLRHTSIRTTMDIYGHLLPQDLENVMEKIGEIK